MRNKLRIVIFISLSACIIAGAVFYLLNNYLSADITGPDFDINKMVQNYSSELTKVDYSKEQILSAFENGKKDSLFEKIIKDIATQADKQTIKNKNLSLKQQGEKNSNQQIDIQDRIVDGIIQDKVIILTDFQNQIVFHPNEENDVRSGTADDFEFDPGISQEVKNFLINGYPKIESIYGQRANSGKIKIHLQTGCYRHFALPTLNTIVFCDGIMIDEEMALHELTHIFHGNWTLSSLWEEGAVVVVSEKIVYGTVFVSLLPKFDIVNVPTDDYFDAQTSSDGYTTYEYGATAMYKLFIQDNNFFKKFNNLLYHSNRYPPFSHQDLIAIVAEITPEIEGNSTYLWFSRFYAFLPTDKIAYKFITITSGYLIAEQLNIQYDYDLIDTISGRILIYDYYGKLLASSKALKFSSGIIGSDSFSYFAPEFRTYTGAVKLKIIYDNYPADAIQEIYLPCFANWDEWKEIIPGEGVFRKYDLVGIAAGGIKSVLVKKLKTNASRKFAVKNGLFRVKRSGTYSPEGIYSIVFYRADNTAAREIKINKGDSKFGTHIMLDDHLSNESCGISGTTTTKTSSKISTSCNQIASQVLLFMSGPPTMRRYEKNSVFEITDLQPNRNYWGDILVGKYSFLGFSFRTRR